MHREGGPDDGGRSIGVDVLSGDAGGAVEELGDADLRSDLDGATLGEK